MFLKIQNNVMHDLKQLLALKLILSYMYVYNSYDKTSTTMGGILRPYIYINDIKLKVEIDPKLNAVGLRQMKMIYMYGFWSF